MKKSFISIVVGLLMLGMGGNVWAGNVVAADLNCTNPAGCVQDYEISDRAVTSTKISDGAVSNSKLADWSVNGAKIVDYSVTDTKLNSNAVTTAKIVDGAVTDAKITGPISSGKIEKPSNVLVVAKSGGDFSSIQAAIDSINPPSENPYLLKIMPGVYTENITLKSNIHLQGSGYEVTTIQALSQSEAVIKLTGVASAAVSNLTIEGGSSGIEMSGCTTLTIKENRIKANSWGINSTGSSADIRHNIIDNNWGGITSTGSTVNIQGNTITGQGNYYGGGLGMNIVWYSTANIVENTISEYPWGGIRIISASAKVLRNTILGTISYAWGGSANICFNIVEQLYSDGWPWVAMYNIRSDGTPL